MVKGGKDSKRTNLSNIVNLYRHPQHIRIRNDYYHAALREQGLKPVLAQLLSA